MSDSFDIHFFFLHVRVKMWTTHHTASLSLLRTQKYCKYFTRSALSVFSPSSQSPSSLCFIINVVCCRMMSAEKHWKEKFLAENWLASIYFIFLLGVEITHVEMEKSRHSAQMKINLTSKAFCVCAWEFEWEWKCCEIN